MKKMTCAFVGGPSDCAYEMMGNSAEEVLTSGMPHVTEAHPELAAKIAAMPAEEMAAWSAEFETKFAAFPEATV